MFNLNLDVLTVSDKLDITGGAILGALISILYCIVIFKYTTIVREQEEVVIERCGQFKKVLKPGCHCLLPFFDSRVEFIAVDYHFSISSHHVQQSVTERKGNDKFIIDKRLQVLDMPLQPVITRDNVQLEVHPMALYKVTDSMLAVYEVQNLYSSIQILISTTLADIVGRITLDDTLCSRQEVRRQVFNAIHSTIQNWGALLIEVDILEIDPPENIALAMQQQLIAERERRAKLVGADADRQIKKIQADSRSEESILHTTGESQSMIMIAEAEAEGEKVIGLAQADVIGMLSGKVKGFDVGDFQLKNYWLDAIEAVACNSRSVQLIKSVETLQKLFE